MITVQCPMSNEPCKGQSKVKTPSRASGASQTHSHPTESPNHKVRPNKRRSPVNINTIVRKSILQNARNGKGYQKVKKKKKKKKSRAMNRKQCRQNALTVARENKGLRALMNPFVAYSSNAIGSTNSSHCAQNFHRLPFASNVSFGVRPKPSDRRIKPLFAAVTS